MRFADRLLGVLAWLAIALPASAQPFPGAESLGRTVSTVTVSAGPGVGDTQWVADLAQRELEGQPLTLSRVQDVITLIYASGHFRDVQVTPRAQDGEVTVEVRLLGRALIRQVEVHGNRAFSDAEIARTLQLGRGDPLEPARFDRDASVLLALYRREGFPEAQIRLEAGGRETDAERALVIHVNEGPPVRVGAIYLEGLTRVTPAQLGLLGLSPGDRLSHERLTRLVETLRARMVSRGFVAAVIGRPRLTDQDGEPVSALDAMATAQEVTVSVPIQEGTPIEVRVEGARHFSPAEIARNLTLVRRRAVNEGEVRRSAQDLAERYREDGYLFAQVDGRLDTRSEPWQVQLTIDEGPRVRTEDIRFIGALSLPRDRLLGVMESRPPRWLPFRGGEFRPKVFEEDLRRLRTLYRASGFEHVTVEAASPSFSADRQRVTPVVSISEGPRTMLREIRILGAQGLPEERLREALQLQVGEPLNRLRLPSEARALEAVYLEEGYPDVSVSQWVVEDDQHQAMAVFQVSEGMQRLIGPIVARGVVKTRPQLLFRAMDLEPGARYRTSRILAAQRRIFELGLFREASLRPLLPDRFEDRREVPMLLTVVEEDSGWWNLEAGYGDLHGPSMGSELRLWNLAGTGRQLLLAGNLGLNRQGVDMRVGEPFILGSPYTGRAGLFAERDRTVPAFTAQRAGVNLGLDNIRLGNWSGTTRYELSRTQIRDVSDEVDPAAVLAADRYTNALFWDMTQDWRDNLIDPTAGSLSEGSLQLATPLFGGRELFLRPGFRYTRFFDLWGSVLATRGWLTTTLPLGGPPSLDNRLFTGGPNSVRGYGLNAIGARTPEGALVGGLHRVVANVEARFSFGDPWGGVLFLDGGGSWSGEGNLVQEGFFTAVGVGLRYQTPIGPLRLDYGHRLTPAFGIGAVNLGVGHAF